MKTEADDHLSEMLYQDVLALWKELGAHKIRDELERVAEDGSPAAHSRPIMIEERADQVLYVGSRHNYGATQKVEDYVVVARGQRRDSGTWKTINCLMLPRRLIGRYIEALQDAEKWFRENDGSAET